MHPLQLTMKCLVAVIVAVLLSACTAREGERVIEVTGVFRTATPQLFSAPGVSGTASLTAKPAATPTITPSPTSTAQAAVVFGNPRGFQLLNPTPVYGAPCGLVDTFDFPLDPPDGEEASSRFGFGGYSNRYEKYHAGEDWGFRSGSNFGKDVHSIGHGEVTYAAPNGWGLDKGTVVVKHVFPWGGYVLSFYGHLDPPSVTLMAGDCVRRGEKIGEIGRPRTSPHLHFEIRYHLPVSTGHGYWSSNPAEAGWLPPSQTIWETRLKASPGVRWTLHHADGLAVSLGSFQEGYLLIQGGAMKAINPLDGTISWQRTISETIRNALLDAVPVPVENTAIETANRVGGNQVYLLDLGGNLTAYSLEGDREILWKANLHLSSNAHLISLPGGGVLAADRRRAIAVNTVGHTLWEEKTGLLPVSWTHIHNQIILAEEDGLWTVSKNGIEAWEWSMTGTLAVFDEKVYLYAADGIYRLELDQKKGTLLLMLPSSEPGAIAPAVAAGLVLVHTSAYDRRLLLLNPAGELVWERSLRNLPQGQWQLRTMGEGVYLLVSHSNDSGSIADVYGVDLESGSLTYLLRGGSPASYSRGTWMEPLGDGLWLLNVAGGPLAAFDPRAAYERISSP